MEEWRGQPIWVVRRTDDMLDTLPKLDEKLRDPASEADQQPEYARNEWRSIKKEYLVLVGTCTHLGCSPLFEDQPTVELEHGGFFCPCHGSKFDLAGRGVQERSGTYQPGGSAAFLPERSCRYRRL